MNIQIPFRRILIFALAFVFAARSQAQWLTQSLNLKAGWNAVYLHVDSKYDTLDNLVGSDVTNPIQEIWAWSPAPDTVQFIKDPSTPAQVNNWITWFRTGGSGSGLTRLPGNVACLVRSTSDYTWNVKGMPVAPSYQWTGSGLNFFGFPTLPGAATPTFDTFFSPAPDLKLNAEIFRYIGGAITDNPVPVYDLTATKARRGEAFWIRSANFNSYFGPFDTLLGSAAGLDFDDAVGQRSFRIRNHTKANLDVRLTMVASETPPTGQTPIIGVPPILVRGAINLTNLTYAFSDLSSPVTINLKPDGQPGSDVEVVLGLNRSAMPFPVGSLVAGTLRMTDSLNYSQVDVPVSAKVNSTAGLWVGSVAVTKVNQYLTTYYTADTDIQMLTILSNLTLLPAPAGITYARDAASRRIIKYTETNGVFLVKNVNSDSTDVSRPYPLRLIIHNDPTGTATLLQRAFIGLNSAGDQIVATKETSLDQTQLASARRISAAHLPFTSANSGWVFSGPLNGAANVTATVALSHDDQSSNPFLHTYHPDHDNLDAQFAAPLPPGEESYGLTRLFRLVVGSPTSDFDSLTSAGSQFNGQYFETITLTGKNGFTRSFDSSGAFTLNRITTTPTLTN